MADQRAIVGAIIGAMSSVVSALSSASIILSLLLLKLKTFQESFLGQCAMKQNFHVKKLKQISLRRAQRKQRSFWVKPGRTEQWWVNLWQGHLPEDEWHKNLRMSRDVFMRLVGELRPYISHDPRSPNRNALLPEKKLAMTLYYLKDMGSISMTANTFGVARSTVSVVVLDVCCAINSHLGPNYIKLPKTVEEMRELVVNFESKHGFPQAMGCVDGTHIAIQQPLENSQDDYSYKMKYTINVQGVCDWRGIFIDVDCRWPGSVHDAKVFSNSRLNYLLRENKLPQLNQTLLPGFDKVPVLLLADPAYTLLPYCMKEYNSCSTNDQVVFNDLLRTSRNPIECAYGRLKSRWQILNRKLDMKLEHVPQIIYTCFILHNFCEVNFVSIDNDDVQRRIEYDREMQPNTAPSTVFSYNSAEGLHVRDIITEYIKEYLTD